MHELDLYTTSDLNEIQYSVDLVDGDGRHFFTATLKGQREQSCLASPSFVMHQGQKEIEVYNGEKITYDILEELITYLNWVAPSNLHLNLKRETLS